MFVFSSSVPFGGAVDVFERLLDEAARQRAIERETIQRRNLSNDQIVDFLKRFADAE